MGAAGMAGAGCRAQEGHNRTPWTLCFHSQHPHLLVSVGPVLLSSSTALGSPHTLRCPLDRQAAPCRRWRGGVQQRRGRRAVAECGGVPRRRLGMARPDACSSPPCMPCTPTIVVHAGVPKRRAAPVERAQADLLKARGAGPRPRHVGGFPAARQVRAPSRPLPLLPPTRSSPCTMCDGSSLRRERRVLATCLPAARRASAVGCRACAGKRCPRPKPPRWLPVQHGGGGVRA